MICGTTSVTRGYWCAGSTFICVSCRGNPRCSVRPVPASARQAVRAVYQLVIDVREVSGMEQRDAPPIEVTAEDVEHESRGAHGPHALRIRCHSTDVHPHHAVFGERRKKLAPGVAEGVLSCMFHPVCGFEVLILPASQLPNAGMTMPKRGYSSQKPKLVRGLPTNIQCVNLTRNPWRVNRS